MTLKTDEIPNQRLLFKKIQPYHHNHSNKHEKQLLFKGEKSGFAFQFSTNSNDLYLNSINQNIDYSWTAPTDNNSVAKAHYRRDKTIESIVLNGSIYVNSQLGVGINNFYKFQENCRNGEIWKIVDSDGKKIAGNGEGLWFVTKVSRNSSDFITGINALKIIFTINLKNYS